MEFKPPFIDVTSLREDYIYKQHETGLLEKLGLPQTPGYHCHLRSYHEQV
jgi:methylenetetrahydrofolate reductase (NADPH)